MAISYFMTLLLKEVKNEKQFHLQSKSRTIYIYTKISPFSFCIWQLENDRQYTQNFAYKSPYLRSSCSQYILYFLHYSGCQFYTISLCIKGSPFLQLLTTFSSLSFKTPINSLLIVLNTFSITVFDDFQVFTNSFFSALSASSQPLLSIALHHILDFFKATFYINTYMLKDAYDFVCLLFLKLIETFFPV